MKNRQLLIMMSILSIFVGVSLAHAGPGQGIFANGAPGNPTFYANSPSGDWMDWQGVVHSSGTALRKFVDGLPLLGTNGAPTAGTPGKTQGSSIPVAVPNTPYQQTAGVDPYPGSDYYEIGIVEYTQWMHSDLPKATKLRGYVQLVPSTYPGAVAFVRNSVTYYSTANPTYLGPVIVATKGKPVRIKYTNLLPTGAAGDLFIPVDKTLMGAGMGPDGMHEYTQNRIAIHLHGGHTAWVSDGTPHQWTVPVGETGATWMNGASFANVPDMANPGQGSGTLFYTNDQPARLMFYHDHAYGITRLNVYSGMAAGYLLQDAATTGEWTLPIPADQIPLVIQDKTFVPSDVVNGAGTGQDQKWDTTHWGAYGDLWFPHVYETNQTPMSADGTNPVGRWDWAPGSGPCSRLSSPCRMVATATRARHRKLSWIPRW